MNMTDFDSRLAAWWQGLEARLQLREIPALNSIRAAAVMLVIMSHFGIDAINGALGVQMFFTLSGFLITWLLIKENERFGHISFKGFYGRRILRIFPAMYFYIAFGLLILLVRGREVPWKDIITSILYLQNYISFEKETYVRHTWSLAVEEQFYILWPLAFYALRKNYRNMVWTLVVVTIVSWAVRASYQLASLRSDSYIYHAFETRMDQLAVGCFLALVLHQGLFKKVLFIITSNPVSPLVIASMLGLSSLFHGNHDYRYPVAYSIEPLLTATLIVSLIVHAGHPLWRFTNSGLARYLGKISYSLYLYQQLTLSTARRLTENYSLGIQVVFAVAVTICFAMFSYHFVERRFRPDTEARNNPLIPTPRRV